MRARIALLVVASLALLGSGCRSSETLCVRQPVEVKSNEVSYGVQEKTVCHPGCCFHKSDCSQPGRTVRVLTKQITPKTTSECEYKPVKASEPPKD